MITRDDPNIEIILTCESEDIPIKGNASAIDDETDRETERWIADELDRGNEWAWCCAHVSVTWYGFKADDYLGCCSYKSERDFREPGGYFDDMVSNCIAQINEQVKRACGASVALERAVVR